ncbi:ankyrin repeat-containing domain protein [Nemania abortiva]|nr:ankyrin repeat-containing domain protein [Nemania abortiva]
MASDDWERHKATILHLYLLEKAPLRHVVSCMQKNHGFAKTKSQYEYQLKKWGVKKKIGKKYWQNLRQQLKRRTGKESEVILFGIPVSPSRVRKETRRYTSIPTAKEFGKRSPGPELPDGVMVRVQTPPIIEDIMWPPLPWFQFKNRIFPTLRNPSGLLNTFLAALGFEKEYFYYDDKESPFAPLFDIIKNPSELRRAALHLTNMVPDDAVGRRQKAENLTQQQLSVSMATEILKLVFFSLSNNNIPNWDVRGVRIHDRFVLRLIEVVSRTNPEMSSCFFSGYCTATKTIKEQVYRSAIRERNYAIVSRLLESGVDPNMTIPGFYHQLRFKAGCGIQRLDWNWYAQDVCGIHAAATTCDIRLARILLNAGAKANCACLPDDGLTPPVVVTCDCLKHISALEVAASAGGSDGTSDKSVEFAQLLAEHGALSDRPGSCRNCQHSELLSSFATSIIRHNDRMTEFLTEKGASGLSYSYTKDISDLILSLNWVESSLDDLEIECTLLNLAIFSGNQKWARKLLQPLLSHPMQASEQAVKQALMTSILAGDTDTASKVLACHPSIIAINQWPLGVTPLVATAWNEDRTIATILLRMGACIGPTLIDQVSQTSVPAPIHVAAYHGNTSLVRHLIDRGVDCNVRYIPFVRHRDPLYWLVPSSYSSPLQLALASEKIDTANLLMRQLSLFGGLVQEINSDDRALILQLLRNGPNDLSANRCGESVAEVEAAAEVGSMISIMRSYFLRGGTYHSRVLYLSVRAAIKSKDYSIVRLLADQRPIAEIDGWEASSLVLSIENGDWNLISLLLSDPFLPASSQSCYHWGDNTWKLSYYDGGGLTPLGWVIHSAIIRSASEPIVEKLIQRGYKLQGQDIPSLFRNVPDALATIWDWVPLESMDLTCRQALLLCSIESCNMEMVHRCIESADSLDFYHTFRYVGEHPIPFGVSPLGLATHNGNVELIHLLLDAGASVDFVDGKDYGTALNKAVVAGNLDIVKTLLDRGATAEPSSQLMTRATPLQYSAIKGDLNIARLLISRGADINAPPAKFRGETALEGAAHHGRLDMVQFLLAMGTVLDGKMRIYYVRSVRFARSYGHYTIANFLKECGSWGERDQVLYDRDEVFDDDIYFRYDEATDDWHIRKMKKRVRNGGNGCEYCSVGSSNSSSTGSLDEPNGSDDDIRETGKIMDDSDGPLNTYHPSNHVRQSWWDSMELAFTEPYGLNPADQMGSGYDVSSSQSQRVIELDEALEDEDASQSTTIKEGANGDIINQYMTGQLKTWDQARTTIERESELALTNYTIRPRFPDEHSLTLNEAETEWEGPFSNFREVEEMNAMFGVLPFRL